MTSASFLPAAFILAERAETADGSLPDATVLRALLEQMPAGIAVADVQTGQVVFGNRKSEEIFGGPTPNCQSVNDYSLFVGFHPDGRRVDNQEWPLARAIAGEVIRGAEFQVERPDGSRCWIRADASPVCDEDGTPVAAVAAFNDITEQKRLEAAQRAAAADYHSFFDNASDGFFRTTLDGRLLRTNLAMAELHGYAAVDEYLEAYRRESLPHGGFVDPADFEAMMAALQAEGQVADYVCRIYRRRTREVLWASFSARMMRDADGTPLYLDGSLRDITPSRQREEALRRAERAHASTSATLREVERMARLGNYEISANTLYWSEEQHALYGVAPGQGPRTLEEFLAFVHPDDRACVRDRNGAPAAWEVDNFFRIVRPDGEVRHIHDRSFLERGAEGSAVRILGINQDVTERIEVEAALRAAKEEFQTLFDHAVDGIYRADLEGNLLIANPAFVRLCGFATLQDLQVSGLALGEDLHVDPRDHVALKEILARDGAVANFATEVYHPRSRERLWVALSAHLQRNEAGKVVGYEALLRDITASVRAKEALERNQRHLERAQAIADLGSWERSLVDGTAEWSDQCYAMLGVTPDQFDPSRDDITAFIHVEDRDAYCAWMARLAGGQAANGLEVRVVQLDGTQRHARLEGEPLLNRGGRVIAIAGTIQDITDRAAQEAALRASEAHLDRAQSVAAIGSWELDLSTHAVTWSAETYRLYGLEPGRFVPRLDAVLERFHPEDRPGVEQQLEAVLRGSGGLELQSRFVRCDGAVRWGHYVIETVTDSDGALIALVGTVQDITARKEIEADLRYKHLLLSTQQELMPDGVMVAGMDNEILSWNSRFRDMWGLTDELLQQGSAASFPLALAQIVNQEAFQQQIAVLYRDPHAVVEDAELQLKDGRSFLWHSRGLVNGTVGQGRVWFFRDISARKAAERQLQEAHALQQIILDSTDQIIIAVDKNTVIRSFNRAAERLLGYKAEELIGKAQPYILHDPAEVEERRLALSRELEREVSADELFQDRACEGEVVRTRWHFVSKSNYKIPVELAMTPLCDEQGQVTGYLGVASDISERLRQEQRLVEFATRDGLTGLWNRRHFLDTVAPVLGRAGREQEAVAVLLLDIDEFKQVNDTHGHAAGDAALQAVAAALPSSLRAGDLWCRWGGEEFAVVLPNSAPEAALVVAERLREAVSNIEVKHEDKSLRVTTSIGLAAWHRDEPSLDKALQRADTALYQAKAAGRNCVHAAQPVEGEADSGAGAERERVPPDMGSRLDK